MTATTISEYIALSEWINALIGGYIDKFAVDTGQALQIWNIIEFHLITESLPAIVSPG